MSAESLTVSLWWWRLDGLDALEPTVVLVEGFSDEVALETLARRRGRDLAGERIYIVAMGGATNIGQFLDVFGPVGTNVELGRVFTTPAKKQPSGGD